MTATDVPATRPPVQGAPAAPHGDPEPQVRPGDFGWVVLGGAALIAGIFLDGFAHGSLLDDTEDFLTVWHLVVAGGYAATVLAFVRFVLARRTAPGIDGLRAALPDAARPALAGLVLFALAFSGDGIWHTVFGVETSLDALLSPTHLMMMLGILLVMSAPVRVLWRSAVPRDAGWRDLWVGLLALQLGVAILAFFAMEFLALDAPFMSTAAARFAEDLGDPVPDLLQVAAVMKGLVTTVLLVVPLLAGLARFDLPRGAVLALLTVTTTLLTAVDAFAAWPSIVVAVVAGLVLEVARTRLAPRPERPAQLRAFAALVPVVTLGLRYATTAIDGGIGWVVEIPTGTVVLGGLLGYGLGLLAAPPRGAAGTGPGRPPGAG